MEGVERTDIKGARCSVTDAMITKGMHTKENTAAQAEMKINLVSPYWHSVATLWAKEEETVKQRAC